MEKIIVTGGLGFIGSNFISLILSRRPNIKVINIDSETYAANLEIKPLFEKNENYQYLKSDISSKKEVSSLLENEDIDAIINFAAESHVDNSISNPHIFLETNIFGTFNLLECLRNSKNRDAIFLHVSTDEVYGSLTNNEEPFSEKTPYKPNSPYSASKAASDFLVRAWYETYKMNVITTNCSNNYGPNQNSEKLIPKIISNATQGKEIPIYGDGSNIRDWLYVEDHCDAILKVLESKKYGQTFNIGGNNEISNLEIVNIILNKLDSHYFENKISMPAGLESFNQLITFVEDRKGHDFRYAINSNKIKSELEWQPMHSFESGITKTIEWYLNQ